MSGKLLEKVRTSQLKKDIPDFRVGDTVRVHVRIKEGDRERVQPFSGVVIARDGSGATETFTVRRVSYGEGVERVFPVHARSIAKIEIEKRGRVRRAKLYYLSRIVGKKSKVAEKQESE